MHQARPRSAGRILIDQFKNAVVRILGLAVVLSFAFGELVDGMVILLAVAINTLIDIRKQAGAVVAIEEGRGILNNIRKSVIHLLSGNASQILIVFIASLFN